MTFALGVLVGVLIVGAPGFFVVRSFTRQLEMLVGRVQAPHLQQFHPSASEILEDTDGAKYRVVTDDTGLVRFREKIEP